MTIWSRLLIAAWFGVIAVNHLPVESEQPQATSPELIILAPPEMVNLHK